MKHLVALCEQGNASRADRWQMLLLFKQRSKTILSMDVLGIMTDPSDNLMPTPQGLQVRVEFRDGARFAFELA